MVEEETEEEKEVEEVGGHEEATDEGVEVAMEDVCFRMKAVNVMMILSVCVEQ